MAEAKKNMPKGRLARFARMSGLSTAMSGSYVVQKVKGVFQDEESRANSRLEAHLKNAERMVETMGHMKGAVMKVGQMLSLGDDAHVPKEFSDILTKLQAEAPTLPFERIYDEIVNALGVQPDAVFDFIDAEPLAAASLAQVHRARLRTGEDVVVKVQYPGVADTVDSDLDNLKGFIRSSGMVGKRFNMDESFREVQEMLHQELDYEQEGKNLDYFGEQLKDWPQVIIPKRFPEYCTKKLLVLEYIEGITFDDWLAQGHSQAEKDDLGLRFVDLFFHCLFNLRTIHGDPQLGNFLFREDGTIIMLDFGCVKRFSADFIDQYKSAVTACYSPMSRPALIQAFHTMGFLDEPKDGPIADYLVRHAEIFMRAFKEDAPATFIDDSYPKDIKVLARDPVVLRGIKFPTEIIYMNRVHLANYFLMRRLGVRANFHRLLAKYVPPKA